MNYIDKNRNVSCIKIFRSFDDIDYIESNNEYILTCQCSVQQGRRRQVENVPVAENTDKNSQCIITVGGWHRFWIV